MQVTNDTPRQARTIAGISGLMIPQPYADGQTINAAEASMLNQTIAENFSNNLRKRIEEFVPEGAPEGTKPRKATAEEAQAIVDAYAGEYEPGVRRSGGGGGKASLSPVEVEMRNIATAKLKEVLKSKGLRQKDVAFTELRDQLIAQNEEPLRKAAEKIVRAREKETSGDDLLASINKSLANEVAGDEQQQAAE